jgi:NTE family protein
MHIEFHSRPFPGNGLEEGVVRSWRQGGALWSAVRRWTRAPDALLEPAAPVAFEPPRIGLALGGGFARGIAHVGVLRVLEQNHIAVHCIAGVSAGSICAAAFASGANAAEIGKAAAAMRFADVARWSICRMGFVVSERMVRFLGKLLKCNRFEEMRIPLGVVATDLVTGEPVLFRDTGDVFAPIRASCSYPGLFAPVRYDDRLLVDGAMSMEVPAEVARSLGATRVISVHLPMQNRAAKPSNMFQVVNRCFQIMQTRTEGGWREHSDLVITPDVRGIEWDAFKSAAQLVEAGEQAALAALPAIKAWLAPEEKRPLMPSGLANSTQALQV